MLDKIKAICNFEGIDINEIKEISFYEGIFVLNNGKEFYVLTNEEAQIMYEEMEKDLIEDIGLECFTEYTQDYIINNCLKMEYFNQALNEYHTDYVYDMYEDELEEMYDIWEVDNEKDLIEKLNLQYENGFQFFQEMYDDRELTKLIIDKNLIDIDKVISFCQESDGRGHIIASYDGIENIIEIEGEEYYIYRLN